MRTTKKKRRSSTKAPTTALASYFARASTMAPSLAPARSPTERTSLSPRGTRAAAPWGSPWPARECAPRDHSGCAAGRCRCGEAQGVPRVGAAGSGPGRRGKLKTWKPRNLASWRGAASGFQISRFPGFQRAATASNWTPFGRAAASGFFTSAAREEPTREHQRIVLSPLSSCGIRYACEAALPRSVPGRSLQARGAGAVA
jgi:hypothetical protein